MILKWSNEKQTSVPQWEMIWYRRIEYRAICSSFSSFARAAHSFTCSAALIRSLAHSKSYAWIAQLLAHEHGCLLAKTYSFLILPEKISVSCIIFIPINVIQRKVFHPFPFHSAPFSSRVIFLIIILNLHASRFSEQGLVSASERVGRVHTSAIRQRV